MTDRIIDLSEGGARLSTRHSQLVVELEDERVVTTPLEEIAALVVASRAVTFTQPVLAGIAEAGGVVVICDSRCLPIGMMLPLVGHHLQCERFMAQAAASQPVRKQAWKQIVAAKVHAQARLLLELGGDDLGLAAMAVRVKSGDAGNTESMAARRYWPALFGDPGFRRNRDAPDQNRLLNYGYAVLRAIVARAICGSGLHPSLGIHHRNRYDSFPLADDLMEPFRAIVDRAVVAWLEDHDRFAPLDKEAKALLIQSLLDRFEVSGEARTLFDSAARVAAGLARMFLGEGKRLALPALDRPLAPESGR